MRLMSILFLLFISFPYLKLLPSSGYNQPYAFLISFPILFLVNKRIFSKFPKNDWIFLVSFFVVGFLAFLITCQPYNILQEYKYLLNYLSPIVLVLASYVIISKLKSYVVIFLTYALYFWLSVSIVQIFFNPNFLVFLISPPDASLGANIIDSGRGALGLAPESTHNGFHLLLLGISVALLNGSKKAVVLSIIGAVFVALSSSSVLALVLGYLTYVLFNSITRIRSVFIFVLPFLLLSYVIIDFFLIESIYSFTSNSNIRVFRLLSIFIESPMDILTIDYSVNARIGGLISGWSFIFYDFFLPHGLSHAYWTETADVILQKTSWLKAISGTGIPSGIGVVFFQIGFFGFLLIYPFYRVIKSSDNFLSSVLVFTFIYIFLFQFTISTPIFSFIYAIAIFRRKLN